MSESLSESLEDRLTRVTTMYEELVAAQRAEFDKSRAFHEEQKRRMEARMAEDPRPIGEQIATRREEAADRSKAIYEAAVAAQRDEAEFHREMLAHLREQTELLRTIIVRMDAPPSEGGIS